MSVDWRTEIYSGDISLVEKLIKNKGNCINISVEETTTPLIDAIRTGNAKIVELFIKHGAQVNHVNTKIPNPLLTAIKIGSHDIVKLLLINGVDTSILPVPCINKEMIKTILDSGVKVNTKNAKSKTFLHYAIKNNDLEVIKMLFEYGADVNIKDDNGCYPIHIATRSNSYEIIKLLLEKGAYANVKDNYGNSPLHNAAKYGDYACIKLVLDHTNNISNKCNKGVTPLHNAILYNRSAVELLINNRSINDTDVDGYTPLHYALQPPCSIDIIDILLYNNADISIKDNNGRNPIDTAFKYINRDSVIKELLANAVLINEVGKLKDTTILEHKEIKDNTVFSNFVYECNEEIKKMKKTKCVGDYSMFDVYMIRYKHKYDGNKDSIKDYLRCLDDNSTRMLKTIDINEFPIYSMYLVRCLYEYGNILKEMGSCIHNRYKK
ncbi:ankyrin repeat protein [Fowlpox virus]|nr:ankyrin repeat protein [Fowlpox virus]AYO90097.1 ankyrin repeat protein [Fowlpox virus]AYO90354.1 ankyrin repeat protein [Fowlpox virus]AYO90611.1 ankyrin repeat protein [Fowlpox virus]